MQKVLPFGVIQTAVLSFFSGSIYRHVAVNQRGAGWRYLFLVLALCWLPLSYHLINGLLHFRSDILPALLNDMPAMEIVNGKLWVDSEQPYVIADPLTDKPVIVVDKIADPHTISATTTTFLLTEGGLSIQDSTKPILIQWPQWLHISFEKEQLQYDLQWLLKTGIWLLYPGLVLVSFIYRCLQSLLYMTLACLIFGPLFQCRMTNTAFLRVTVVAMTPAIVLSTVLALLGIRIPHEYLLYFMLTAFYLMLGVWSNRYAKLCYP